MSAPSPPATRSADQVASSLEQGRKLILQLVCGGYLVYLAAHRLLLPGAPLPALGPQLLTGYFCAVAVLLSVLPHIRFRLLTVILTAAFLPYAAFELLSNLQQRLLPLGYLTWTPLIVALCFCILGWRQGAAAASVMLLTLFGGLWVFRQGSAPYPSAPTSSTQYLDGWLSQGLMLTVMTLICTLITRYVEERLQVGHEASVQLAAARMDTLTGVMGRAASELYLREGLTQIKQAHQPLSLLLCDLDNFKAVNDRYGHPVGDAVLKAAARRLRRQTGASGQVGRWGGEEFVVVLPGISKSDAVVMAEHMRRAIAGQDLAGLPVTASFGVASYRPGDDVAELFERADQRLYEAKNSGRNTVRG